MRRIPRTFAAIVLALVFGCVTIPSTLDLNIDITIRHIEEQADEFLDYVEGKSDALPGLEEESSDGASLFQRGIDFVAPMRAVYAAEFKDSSPRVTQIAEKMRGRNKDIEALKGKGFAGENNRGFLESVNANALSSPEERNEAQRMVAAENEDRKALYKEIARLNKDQNLKVATLERVYAQKRLERAKPGQMFQLPPAGDDFNKFKASPAGKKLGSQCMPDAWVAIK